MVTLQRSEAQWLHCSALRFNDFKHFGKHPRHFYGVQIYHMEEAHRTSMASLRQELAEANRQELSTSQAYNQVHACMFTLI